MKQALVYMLGYRNRRTTDKCFDLRHGTMWERAYMPYCVRTPCGKTPVKVVAKLICRYEYWFASWYKESNTAEMLQRAKWAKLFGNSILRFISDIKASSRDINSW